ncbi:MAG: DUF3108 domain-containing protein [Prevotella sp.]|nr:DUF3108 domain-containing protein [Prevotella sp.]
MRHIRQILFFMVLTVFSTSARAQCTMTNTAFKGGEKLAYNLYFNWKFVWVKAGTAAMTTTQSTYKGQQAYKASLTTSGNKRADNLFFMRDTLLSYVTTDLAPLYYRKGAVEGKRYTVDEVWYTYPNGKCNIRQQRFHKDGKKELRNYVPNSCVYDMLTIFLRARSFDLGNWTVGKVVNFQIADGKSTNPAQVKFCGKKTIKGDNEVKYRCLELSYTEKEKGKWREIARFFVTDDANHVPVRLDMFLKFGSAKAFLTSMSGTRNEVKSIVK